MEFRAFVLELRRRRVLRAAGLYIVAAWVAVQVISLILPAINVPDSALLYVWLAAILLFPLALVFAWRYEIGLEGVARTPPADPDARFDPSLKRTDYIILTAITAVAATIALQLAIRIDPEVSSDVDEYSIAVLPLVNIGAATDQKYFALGMQASLIFALSQVQRLRVTSKASTLKYDADSDLSLREIGQALGVAKVIEGLVARRGDTVSIAVQLFDAREDRSTWSATFEDTLANINFLQSRIALEVANQIKVDVTPEDRAKFQSARTVNPEAYLAFLRGVFHVERFNPEDMQLAREHFQRAVDLDPDYAKGYWGLAKLCGFMTQAGLLTPEEGRAQCRPPIERALELDPFLPEAYLGMAVFLTWQDFDFEAARPQFERAIELNPSYAEAHMFYSHYLGIVGELDKSSYHMKRALEFDPLNPFVQGLFSIQLVMIDDFERAIDVATRALESAPGIGFGYVTLVVAHHELGNKNEAIDAYANMLEIVSGQPEAANALRELYVQLGYEAAMRTFAQRLEVEVGTRPIPLITIGELYEYGGDIDTAVQWYRRAWEASDPDSPYLGVNMKDPRVQAHPDFLTLLRDMKLDYWADEYARRHLVDY